MKKKTKTLILVLVLLLIVSVSAVGIYFGVVQQSVISDDFVKPLWAHLGCEKSDTISHREDTIPTSSSSTGYLLRCGDDEFTDLCDFKVLPVSGGFFTTNIKIQTKVCSDYDGNVCTNWQDSYVNKGAQGGEIATDIPDKESIRVRCFKSTLGIFNSPTECIVSKSYYKFTLIDDYGGKSVVNSANCNLPYNAKNNILKVDDPGSSIEKGAWVNYVHDWVYGPPTNVFSHPTYGEVYCSGHNVYSIIKVQVVTGGFQQLDPTYKSTDENGKVYNGLGTNLGEVECCPNVANCGEDFKYQTSQGHACTSDAQCMGGGAPVAATSTGYKTQNCINKVCTWSSLVTVQCTDDSACASGLTCDLAIGSPTRWRCIGTPSTSYCGDHRCDSSKETPENCPQDCTLNEFCEDKLGGLVPGKTITTEGCYGDIVQKALCEIGLKDKQTQSECVHDWTFLWIVGLVFIIIIVIVLIFLRPKHK